MNKERKFLFDQNNFDLPDVEPEPEVYVEPPPLFSLDELGFARDDAFAKGREAGLEEARISREQYIASQTETIVKELKFLLGAENYRAAIYEREAIALTETIFKTIFPHFSESAGLSEVREMISKIILHQPDQPMITIELPESDLDPIKELFTDADIDFSKITFTPSASLTRGSCRMLWKDGGALRDQKAIADEVLRTLRAQLPKESSASIEEEAAPTLANTDEKDETNPEDLPKDSQGD